MEYVKCADYSSDSPSLRDLDLKSAIQVTNQSQTRQNDYNDHVLYLHSKAISLPRIWGELNISTNGHSYMNFQLDLQMKRIKDGAVSEGYNIKAVAVEGYNIDIMKNDI